MIHVEVQFTVAPADQTQAIHTLTEALPALQGHEGNRGGRVLSDPNAPGAILLQHAWDSLADLDRYRSDPLFAALGGALRPMMTGVPTTKIYERTEVQ